MPGQNLFLLYVCTKVPSKAGVHSKRQAKRQMKKKIVRLLTIDRKNTKIAALSDFYESRDGHDVLSKGRN